MIRPHRRRVAAILAASTAALLTLTGLTASAAQAEGVEHVVNGTFDSGSTAPWWWTGNAPGSVVDGQLCADIPAGTVNPWDAILGQNDIPLVDGASYTLTFTASASAAVNLRANVQLGVDPFTAPLSRDVTLGAAQTFTFTFTSTLDSAAGQVAFQVGGAAVGWTLCLDNISLTSSAEEPPPGGAEQIENGSFDNGTAGWFTYGTPNPGSIVDGRLCATVPGGLPNSFDAGMGQNDVTLLAGEGYRYTFEASGDPAATIRTAVQLQDPPFTADLSQPIALTPAAQSYSFTFTAAASTERAQVVLHVGGNAQPVTVCLDNVSLIGGVEEPPYVPDTGPRVRVNQVGYLPNGPKNATVVTGATEALPWQLKDAAGTVVAAGQTTPRGLDAASGQTVHTVDFSGSTAAGRGFTLTVDGETSFPFDISGDLYRALRSDALQFFYIQRSGIAIDGALVGEQYARPAGHLGADPNQGDTSVPCQPGVCDYRLDVRGGWYDAGDHGKYVVNGGIATYQLLSAYERTKTAPTADVGALGDSTLRVPERGNGVPDVLDEARWELEFLLRMQVPAGQPLAGMAHHKIHDRNWTGLPLQPEDDPELRELHPPSTAATLNLAAAAAQCGRLYARFDKAFADRCLAAARRAWTAAVAHPAILASRADNVGGGAYNDDNVSDEFYWAATELYLTTGERQYLTALTASPHHTGAVFEAGGFAWPAVAALARLDLATVPSGLSTMERNRIRASVVAAADGYLATLRAEAYGLPSPGVRSSYIWGSNSNVINNVVVLATAFDLTGDRTYRDGALQGMDYIFGRNALNHSMVTGYGEKSPQNQHSRIFGHQIDPSLPNPPAGSIAGGPNVNLEDPFASGLLSGCQPQFCYVDHIDSYSTNEVAINWNSALSWIASFLDDQGDGQPAAPSTCDVSYLTLNLSPGSFATEVVVRNTGSTPIVGWTLRWAFIGNQAVTTSWLAHVAQSGDTVTARNQGLNRRIPPGGVVTFGFVASTSLANPEPGLFTLNGGACT